MTKFLFYTDLHLHNVAPRHRKDEYSQSILEKLAEIYATGKSRGVDFVVFGGDFFDVHRMYSYDVISDAMTTICSSGLETYAIVGQHDLKGYNLDTYAKSTLAFLERHCQSWHTLWKEHEIGDIVLFPCHANGSIEGTLKKPISSNKVPVLIAHLLLYDQPSKFSTISTSSVGDNPFALILSGDLHCGFEAHDINGTVFCNPGAVARKATSDNREVKCLIVEVDSAGGVSIESVPLASAKKYDDVFDESFVETVKQTAKMDASGFVSEILELEMDAVDAFELLEKVGKQKGVRKEVLDLIMAKRT